MSPALVGRSSSVALRVVPGVGEKMCGDAGSEGGQRTSVKSAGLVGGVLGFVPVVY
jgi:hypothetical protein